MSIYQDLGLAKVINGSGKMTDLGVSKISDTVANAMMEAGQNFVVIKDLMDKAGEKIAKITGGENACITSSASAGIALSVAGLITGENLSLIERLPDSSGLKNKIIIQKGHCVNYGAPVTTMIRLGGGEVCEIGQSNETQPFHLANAIDEKTVAILYIKSHHCVQKGMLSLEEVCEIGKKYHIPVIVDAAAEEDIKKYLLIGADLVIYSGAKAFCGPATGFVVGKENYIKAIKLQYKGIGRAMKVDKMAITGLLKALEEYVKRDEEASITEQLRLAETFVDRIKNINKISSQIVQDEAGREIYRVQIKLLPEATPLTGKELINLLKKGEIQIHTRNHYSNLGIINFDMRALTEQDLELIDQKLRDIFK